MSKFIPKEFSQYVKKHKIRRRELSKYGTFSYGAVVNCLSGSKSCSIRMLITLKEAVKKWVEEESARKREEIEREIEEMNNGLEEILKIEQLEER